TQEAAKAYDGEHDAVRHLLQHDVLDRADAVACRVVDGGADDARRGDGVGVPAGGSAGMGLHGQILLADRFGSTRKMALEREGSDPCGDLLVSPIWRRGRAR